MTRSSPSRSDNEALEIQTCDAVNILELFSIVSAELFVAPILLAEPRLATAVQTVC